MSSCCIESCTNNYHNNKSVSYYEFPMYQKRHDIRDKCMLLKQRMAWIEAVKDVSTMDLNNIGKKKICSAHFVSGRKAHFTDTKDVDWVPTIKLNDDQSKIVDDDRNMETKYDFERVDVTQWLKIEESEDVETSPNPVLPTEDEIKFDINIVKQEAAEQNEIISDYETSHS